MAIVLKLADMTATPQSRSALLETAWCAERAGDVFTALQSQLAVAVTVTKVAEVVDVAATAQGRFGFACSRCAEAAELTLTAEFAHHFLGPGQLDAGDSDEISAFDADPDVSEHDGVHVQLDDLLIEYLLLELPRAPLCQPECKGLCPQCGVNFNASSCSCKPLSDAMSPWAKLAAVRLSPNQQLPPTPRS